MCLLKHLKEWRHRRRERIYEGPCEDGGVRISRDADAPKEIESRTLVEFSCLVSLLSVMQEDTALPCGIYRFAAKRTEDGEGCILSYGRDLPKSEQYEKKLPLSFHDELEELIRKYAVAQYNGQYYKVSGLPYFYGASLDAAYASGEAISCYNNQDPFLPIPMVEELCRLCGWEAL